ncbi:MAG: TatD family hydrolase [Bacteroidales bacterium]
MELYPDVWIDVHTHNATGNAFEVLQLFPGHFGEVENCEVCSLGIHPWYINEATTEDLQRLESLASLRQVYAIGEAGLDKNSKVEMKTQEEVFRIQARIAEENGKPLLIHCVGAFNELIRLRKEVHPSNSWIVHGFNNNIHIADQLLRHDIYLSFGRHLLNPAANPARILSQMSEEAFLLETDDSDTGIEEIYLAAGKILGLEPDVVKELVYLNFIRCFRV